MAKPGSDPEWVLFGKNLQAIRLAQNRTQEDVAKAAGMTRQHIGRAETGRVNLTRTTMTKLAKALGISVSDLMTDPTAK